MGGAEVLQHGEPLAEVGLNRRLDDFAAGLGHQSPHAGELTHLFDAAAGTRVGHEEQRVDVVAVVAVIVLELVHHRLGDEFASVGPGIEHLVIPLLVGDDAALEQLLLLEHRPFGLADDLVLVGGRLEVAGGERHAAFGRLVEAQFLHVVQQLNRRLSAQLLVTVGNDVGEVAAFHGEVVKRHLRLQHVVEHDAADGRGDELAGLVILGPFALDRFVLGEPHLDDGVPPHFALRKGHEALCWRGEDHSFTLAVGPLEREVRATHDDVLGGADDGLAVGRTEDVVGRHHQRGGFDLRLDRQRQVDGHLVAVEVGIETFADQRVNLDGVAFDQHGLEGLDTHPVQGGGPVQEHGVIGDHLVQDVPHLFIAPLEHPLGALDRVGVVEVLEPANHERLKQLERDLLGQAALMQLQLGADDDHASRRVVDAFAEQVLAEPALLALDHVGERLERAVGGAEHGPLAPVIVEERVDRLLQHPLFVADDDFRRVEIDELLQPVVAVDDAAIQVVEIACGEVARIEQHQGPQVGRDHRDDVEHHPLGLVVAVAQCLDDLEPLDQVLGLLLAVGRLQLGAQHLGQLDQVELLQELLDGLGAHFDLERLVAVLARAWRASSSVNSWQGRSGVSPGSMTT